MNEGDKQGSGLSWSGLITALLLFASAVLVQQIPLQSSRPSEAAPTLRLFENPQIVAARLWEDPFGAVARHREIQPLQNPSAGTPPTPEERGRFCDAPQEAGSTPISEPAEILAIMVFGGDYEEGREKRRRARYAVVSALLAAGLSPRDQQHIGYIALPLPQDSADPSSPQNDADTSTSPFREASYVPFEWFQRQARRAGGTQPDARSVLLLWLDEYIYRERPLERLASVIGELKTKFQQECKQRPAGVRIIGPASSGTLMAMYREAEKFGTGPSTPLNPNISALTGVEFFSATATAEIPGAAAEANLLDTPGGPQLIRVTSTDKALMKSVLTELELRGLNQACRDPAKSGSSTTHFDHIALVSEWDTEYGRRLPGALIDAQHERCHARVHAALPRDQCDSVEWVHLFAYLAGIDGTLPGVPRSNKQEDSKRNNGNSNGAPPQKMEHADGDSAYDYLRRLGGSLIETHQRLRRNGGTGIRAIGILGSDTYDKLLVLQALRPYFPEALFFTTDLDARYLHPEEYPWARNLIVASHFGLEPSHSMQQPSSFSPFRDSYQTATFLAARLALQGTIEQEVDKPCPPFAGVLDASGQRGRSLERLRDILALLWQPRIFEIGRTQAIDLSPRKGTDADPDAPPAVSTLCLGSVPIADLDAREGDAAQAALQHRSRRIRGIYPEPTDWVGRRGREIAFGAAILGVLAVMCFLLIGKVRTACCALVHSLLSQAKHHPWRFFSVVILAGVAAAAALMVIRSDLTAGKLEPFFWAEGVSTWPSDLIRLLTVLTSFYFLFKAAGSVRTSQQKISKHYFDDERTHPKQEKPGSVTAAGPTRVCYAKVLWQPWKNLHETASNFAAWREYVTAGKPSHRIYRVALLSALHLLFGFMLTKLLGGVPPAPFRGRASELIDGVLLLAAVVLLVVLIFLVIDITRLCIQWVRQTMKAKGWPDSTTRKFSDLLNLKPEWLDEWVDVQVIAKHTSAIQRLIYYPFIVFFLMILARSTLFDNWRTPPALLIILLLNLGYAAFCGYLLRSAVETARQTAIAGLTDKLIDAKGRADEDAKRAASQLEVLIERIKTMREGVFAPFTHQPWVRAILVPISGYGGITLIEFGLRYFR